MGTLVHDYCTNVAVVGNLYAHNSERNPWFKGYVTGVIVNNVIYDPGVWAIRLGSRRQRVVGNRRRPRRAAREHRRNFLRHGASTPATVPMIGTNSRGSAYLEDNVAFDTAGSEATVALVLRRRARGKAGLARRARRGPIRYRRRVRARPRRRPPEDRDAVDERIVTDFTTGAGAIIDSQDMVGGYPTAEPTERHLTVLRRTSKRGCSRRRRARIDGLATRAPACAPASFCRQAPAPRPPSASRAAASAAGGGENRDHTR
jgi:hypothetical protein